MALVESNYLEEQRKLRNIERNHRDREDQRRKLTEQAHLIVSTLDLVIESNTDSFFSSTKLDLNAWLRLLVVSHCP